MAILLLQIRSGKEIPLSTGIEKLVSTSSHKAKHINSNDLNVSRDCELSLKAAEKDVQAGLLSRVLQGSPVAAAFPSGHIHFLAPLLSAAGHSLDPDVDQVR